MEVITEYLILFTTSLLALAASVILMVAASKRSKNLAKVGIALVAVAMAALVRQHYSEFWRVDSCLDSGGRYNHENKKCDMNTDLTITLSPFTSFARRSYLARLM